MGTSKPLISTSLEGLAVANKNHANAEATAPQPARAGRLFTCTTIKATEPWLAFRTVRVSHHSQDSL